MTHFVGRCSQRYLRGSLIVTSNLAFAEWTEVFGDPRLTSALLDRLTHRCHILEFAGDSHRFRQSLHRQAAGSSLPTQSVIEPSDPSPATDELRSRRA